MNLHETYFKTALRKVGLAPTSLLYKELTFSIILVRLGLV
ncbi:hypothetical protein SAMN05443529_1094 [Desulfosporosinus hippei DSM 8344]|uniref:Uncharacterized protein n=1 Tax=Desulfosporosinus hippei DSM 8344 TaxID=1121419 RepID=A0A1G7Z4H3_9FIRM|nr:hypothetical protein SAMN05443529_1094 [Desulfosporosinus hippei DSM 8344]